MWDERRGRESDREKGFTTREPGEQCEEESKELWGRGWAKEQTGDLVGEGSSAGENMLGLSVRQ